MPDQTYAARLRELDRRILQALAASGPSFGKPPGDEPGCTCFHCCLAAGLNPDRLRWHMSGHIDMTDEIERAMREVTHA